MPQVQKIVTTDDILRARSVVREVYLDEKIENYITDIVSPPVSRASTG